MNKHVKSENYMEVCFVIVRERAKEMVIWFMEIVLAIALAGIRIWRAMEKGIEVSSRAADHDRYNIC